MPEATGRVKRRPGEANAQSGASTSERRPAVARGILDRRSRERLKSTVWGGAWGLVVGGVIVAVVSQLAVRHDLMLPQPEARAVETPAGTEFAQSRPETDPEVPSEETMPAADVTAATPAAPEPADTSPTLDTTPAATPAPSFAGPDAFERPDVPEGAEVALTEREGLRPETAGAPEARAPLPPRTEQPAIVAEPAPEEPSAPTEPPLTETAALTAPEEDSAPALADAAGMAAPQPAPEAPAAMAEAVDESAGDTATVPAEEPAPVIAGLETEAPRAPQSSAPETGAPETVAERAPAAPAPAAPRGEVPARAPELSRDLAEAPAEPEAPEAADVSVAEADTAPAPAADSPAIARPAAPEEEPEIPETSRPADAATPSVIDLPRRNGNGSGNIRITQAPEPDAAMPGVPSANVGQRVGTLPGSRANGEPERAAAPPRSGGALAAHRRSFEAEDGLARIAVVLVHESAAPPDAAALSELPEEVSFAVDGGSANAAEIADAYRAAGREVVLIPTIPAGARPQDVEVALQANLRAVDEAVAVMDHGDAGFQSDRQAVGQVIRAIADTGHGLITAPQGLNTAQQIAGRFDVPASLIFDDLGAGVDANAVSRALDRAAFRARLEEGVIVLGRADPATIEGLGDWLQGRNARSLALAPVSAVLAPEETGGSGTEIGSQDEAGGLPRVRSLPDSRSN